MDEMFARTRSPFARMTLRTTMAQTISCSSLAHNEVGNEKPLLLSHTHAHTRARTLHTWVSDVQDLGSNTGRATWTVGLMSRTKFTRNFLANKSSRDSTRQIGRKECGGVPTIYRWWPDKCVALGRLAGIYWHTQSNAFATKNTILLNILRLANTNSSTACWPGQQKKKPTTKMRKLLSKS